MGERGLERHTSGGNGLHVLAHVVKLCVAHSLEHPPRLQLGPHHCFVALQVVRHYVHELGAASLKAQLAAQTRLRQ